MNCNIYIISVAYLFHSLSFECIWYILHTAPLYYGYRDEDNQSSFQGGKWYRIRDRLSSVQKSLRELQTWILSPEHKITAVWYFRAVVLKTSAVWESIQGGVLRTIQVLPKLIKLIVGVIPECITLAYTYWTRSVEDSSGRTVTATLSSSKDILT